MWEVKLKFLCDAETFVLVVCGWPGWGRAVLMPPLPAGIAQDEIDWFTPGSESAKQYDQFQAEFPAFKAQDDLITRKVLLWLFKPPAKDADDASVEGGGKRRSGSSSRSSKKAKPEKTPSQKDFTDFEIVVHFQVSWRFAGACQKLVKKFMPCTPLEFQLMALAAEWGVPLPQPRPQLEDPPPASFPRK